MNREGWLLTEAARLVIRVVVAAVILVLLAYACSAQELTAEIAYAGVVEARRYSNTLIAFVVGFGLVGLMLGMEILRAGRNHEG